MFVSSNSELVGATPLLELTHIEKAYGLKARLFAKIELFNPAGSVKDRVAYKMIVDAESKGIIAPGFGVTDAYEDIVTENGQRFAVCVTCIVREDRQP